eukprot:scaffold207100_cov50-Attheya_sp.AAC.1
MVSPSLVFSPVLPSVIRTPRRSFVRCFFAIGRRSWTSGDARLTLNSNSKRTILRLPTSLVAAAGQMKLPVLSEKQSISKGLFSWSVVDHRRFQKSSSAELVELN